jgi:hypothetical protein
MVIALGGDARIPGTPQWTAPSHQFGLFERILIHIVGSLCIGETASVRMLNLGRELCSDPLAKATLTRLVADESIHSRFGWSVLELLRPTLQPGDLALVHAYLPGWFSDAETAMVADTELQPGAEPHLACGATSPFGTVDAPTRAALFYDTFQHDVVERFERLDIPARDAWARRAA